MPDSPVTLTPRGISGKLLWVHTSREASPDVQGFLVEFPELESRQDKMFLVGRQAHIFDGQWLGHRHVAIAWSAIVKYIVFESREEYVSRLKEWSRIRANARA